MGIQFTNNAESTLLAGISAVATALTVAAGEGSIFPIVAGGSGNYFYVTLVAAGGNREIVKVTQHTAGDTFQVIERTADSIQNEAVPTAYAFDPADKVELRLSGVSLAEFNEQTSETSFLIDSENTGIRVKNNSLTAEIRNAADDAYADLQAANLTLTGALAIAGTATGITNLTASGSLTAASLALTAAITGVTNISMTGTLTGATNITASGTVQAEQITSTDDINATDDITAGGQIAGATGSITGLLTAADLTATNDIVASNDLTVGVNAGIGGSASVTGTLSVGDHSTPTDPRAVNVVYGTGSPPAASGTPIATLFIKYTA